MPRGRKVGDPLPTIQRWIVAEGRRGGSSRPVDAAGDVDLAVQDGAGELLGGFGEPCGGGPAAVGGADEGGRRER